MTTRCRLRQPPLTDRPPAAPAYPRLYVARQRQGRAADRDHAAQLGPCLRLPLLRLLRSVPRQLAALVRPPPAPRLARRPPLPPTFRTFVVYTDSVNRALNLIGCWTVPRPISHRPLDNWRATAYPPAQGDDGDGETHRALGGLPEHPRMRLRRVPEA